MTKPQIVRCCGREIIDSRGNPTVEATVVLTDGTVGVESVPSGASTGIFEAHELRDGDGARYRGKGVTKAVANICEIISPALAGSSASEQAEIDRRLCALDGTDNKARLGANATLAVSLAAARAAANWYGLPVFRYLGGIDSHRMPIPMMNILNGGKHASNNVEIQEFMILPVAAASFSDALRIGSEIYHALGDLLRESGRSATVGDEGGYAPDLASDEDAIALIIDAIRRAGYDTDQVRIALDAAASEWFDEKTGTYLMPKRQTKMHAQELVGYWETLADKYPIYSIEDGLDQRDWDGWKLLTERLGKKIMLVGDDLFVTNTSRLTLGISLGVANSILIKPNQIGTLTETLAVIHTAQVAGYSFIISHRSGETEDTTIADLSVAANAPFIKSGAPCRTDRTAKYNRLLRIESALAANALYGTVPTPVRLPSGTFCNPDP